MPKDRWNDGKAESGIDFHPGFISPWNSNTRKFSEYEEIQTNPAAKHPATMAEQLDGDADTNWGTGKK